MLYRVDIFLTSPIERGILDEKLNSLFSSTHSIDENEIISKDYVETKYLSGQFNQVILVVTRQG